MTLQPTHLISLYIRKILFSFLSAYESPWKKLLIRLFSVKRSELTCFKPVLFQMKWNNCSRDSLNYLNSNTFLRYPVRRKGGWKTVADGFNPNKNATQEWGGGRIHFVWSYISD
jgi:hypothetical protein